MTRAGIAIFKSKTIALVDQVRLTDEEVVECAIWLAASHVAPSNITAARIRQMFDQAVANIDPSRQVAQ